MEHTLHLAAAHLVRIGPGRGLCRTLVQKSHAKPRPHARRPQKTVPQRPACCGCGCMESSSAFFSPSASTSAQIRCRAAPSRTVSWRRPPYSHIRPRTPAAHPTGWRQAAPRRTRHRPVKSAAAARPASGDLPAATPRPAHGLPQRKAWHSCPGARTIQCSIV